MNTFPAHHSSQSIVPSCAALDCLVKHVFASMRLVVVVVFVALLMFSSTGAAAQASGAAPKPQDAPAGNAENGKKVFVSRNCSVCHGNEGQGATGPRIGPPGRSFLDFVRYVRQPTGQMPPVTSQVVPDSELTDIYAYLRSMGPSPQSSLSAASGNAQNGKRIYTSYGCYQCHGGQGQGSTQTAAPRIGPPSLSISAFVSYVRQPTNQMPPYTSKAVPDSDLADIYAFLQSIPMPPPAKSIPLLNQ
jgi:mono/diheme cytochrome c family protein